MNSLIHTITQDADSYRVWLLAGSLILFWNLERLIAFRFIPLKWSHAFTNGAFILTGACVNLAMGFGLTRVVAWGDAHQWGVLRGWPGRDSSWLLFFVAFLALDLGEYVYHVLTHKMPVFWRFHAVHHGDRHVDVSTVLREHPGETLLRLTFTALWVFLLGVPFWVLLVRQFVQIAANTFVHANVKLPDRIERVVGLVFNTPGQHRVHHHYRQPYTDCNYADVLIIWDRLFGTYRRLESANVVFGLDTHSKTAGDDTFRQLMAEPFKVKTANGQANPLRV